MRFSQLRRPSRDTALLMRQQPDNHGQPRTGSGDHRMAAWIFGGLTLLVIIYVVLLGPKELPTYRHQALGFLCAVLSGLFAYFFTGTFAIGGEWRPKAKLSLRAAGGSALFVLVLLWWHSDVAPIKEVREEMRGVREDTQGLVKLVTKLENELGIHHGSVESLLAGVSQSGSPKPSALALELARQIPTSADAYALGLKAVVLKAAVEERRADAERVNSSQAQAAVLSLLRTAVAREGGSASTRPPAAPIPATVPAAGEAVNVPGPAFPQPSKSGPVAEPTTSADGDKAGDTNVTKDARMTKLAWDAYNSNRLQEAISSATACINTFQGAARAKQKEVIASGWKPTLGEPANESEKTSTIKLGALNAVATCWWINADSYLKLSKFGVEGEQPDLDALRKARDAFRATLEYSHGRCWDLSGFFWSPAAAAKDEKLPVIERALSQRVESK